MAEPSAPDNLVTLADWVAERDKAHQAILSERPEVKLVVNDMEHVEPAETFRLDHDQLHTIQSALKIATSACVAVAVEDPTDDETTLEMVMNLKRIAEAGDAVTAILDAMHAGKNVQVIAIPF